MLTHALFYAHIYVYLCLSTSCCLFLSLSLSPLVSFSSCLCLSTRHLSPTPNTHRAIAWEVAKDLALAGVGRLSLVSSLHSKESATDADADAGTDTDSDIELHQHASFASSIQDLNPYVQVWAGSAVCMFLCLSSPSLSLSSSSLSLSQSSSHHHLFGILRLSVGVEANSYLVATGIPLSLGFGYRCYGLSHSGPDRHANTASGIDQ